MRAILTSRQLGRQTFNCVDECGRTYRVVYDVRANWWHVYGSNGRELACDGRVYRRVVAACDALAEKAA